MWKKSKLVLLSGALVFSVTFNTTNYVAFADEPQVTEPEVSKPETQEKVNQNYVKVEFENKILFHEQVPTKTMIQVLNESEEVLESEVLSGDMELQLEKPTISKGKMLSYWSFDRKDGKLLITPILVEEKDLKVKFLSTDGGQLLNNNAQTQEIVKSVNKGTNLKDALPEVNPKENHKFAGWFTFVKTDGDKKLEEKVSNINDIKITETKKEYFAKFYPDFNDNEIDDRTEEITIKFVTNSSEDKFKDIKTHVGKQIKLPVLKKKEAVFMGWYTDEEYKNKFTDGVLTESKTLYAKWEKAEKVIEDAQTKPITDKDISDQIERILKERLQGYENNSNGSSSGNNNSSNSSNSSSTKKPSSYATVIPNPPNVSNSNDTGLSVEQSPSSSYEGNTGTTFKETQYVFANRNVGEVFMVKFFEKDGGFLFSLTLPYGKTVKVFDENENMRGEYGVRQDTTITLDTKDFVNEGSYLLGFDSREIRKNSSTITEVFPKVKADTVFNETLTKQQEAALKDAQQVAKKKSMLKIFLVILLIGAAAGAYVFLKRRKQAKENPEVESP